MYRPRITQFSAGQLVKAQTNKGVVVATPHLLPEEEVKTSYHIFFTSYNPVRGQTDASPCIGASGINQCSLLREQPHMRVIALSQELVGNHKNKPFNYKDRVWLSSNNNDQRCNGEFIVLDTMNQRYLKRGDLFMMESKNNTSCWATITKLYQS